MQPSAIAIRELGAAALHKLWFDVLCNHQVDRYREGLEKLGIHEDPPAVVAAKYHYYTNLIGGLDMEYCEESDRKVWIRYKAPMWVYDGVGMLAMPGGLRRTIFSAWHPRNGRLMGCPRLGYVGTKFIMEGEPYDEGYFFEYDHELGPEEIYCVEPVTTTPEFDPETAPKLDPDTWPEERLLRARRNFSSGYAHETVNALLASHGEMLGASHRREDDADARDPVHVGDARGAWYRGDRCGRLRRTFHRVVRCMLSAVLDGDAERSRAPHQHRHLQAVRR